MNVRSKFVDKSLSIDLLLDYLENKLDRETRLKVTERIQSDEWERGVWEGLQHIYQMMQDQHNPRAAVKNLLCGMGNRFNSVVNQKLSLQLFTFACLVPFLI